MCVAFVEIDAFGAAFVHVDDPGVVEAHQGEDGGVGGKGYDATLYIFIEFTVQLSRKCNANSIGLLMSLSSPNGLTLLLLFVSFELLLLEKEHLF